MADEKQPFRYDASMASEIESRWQRYWDAEGTFTQPNPGDPAFDAGKPKFYCLDMFPYPSGAGLHVGHPEGYTATDILSRYKRMRGYNVLHPMGWDAFGLPAEQYAIRTGVHPAVTTRDAIGNFRRQLKRFGFSYDWSREFGTIDESYYRFTQWIFLQAYGSYFEAEGQRALSIASLEAAFAAGEREVRLNPEAAELSGDEKQERFGPWADLDARTRHRVLDSYRLTYLAEQTVNWCPKLGTALANEEVIDGRSERGGFPVLRKPLKQWLFRITAYGKRLLDGLDGLDWPSSTKVKQAGWIGYSEGAEVVFNLAAPVGPHERLRVFTTRPDTLFGATYMVVAPEHPLVDAALAAPSDAMDERAVRDYVEAARNRSDLERQAGKEKTGVFSGLHAVNPVNGEQIPVWIADYVLMGYGTGAIMAVPAHDDRDHAFAERFGLPIVEVVRPPEGAKAAAGCFSGQGVNVRSHHGDLSLDGMPTAQAKRHITAWLEARGLGQAQHNTKLRDWLFSRQRYWGEPFPIVYDQDGLHHAVSAESLPVTLPALTDYQPEESDEPKPLLAKATEWLHTTAGAAGVRALPPDAPVTRETNTMPGWAGSCWYFLRYIDPHCDTAIAGPEAERYWMGEAGVDLYVGGAEHATLHLLYARFWHQLLFDLGHVSTPEPFKKLFHQGLIQGFAYQRADKSLVPTDEVETRDDGSLVETATGEAVTQIVAKMSKSLKNVVNPDDIITEFGADTFRLYEMYMGPLETHKPWNTRDIPGLQRFLQRTWRLVIDEQTGELKLCEQADPVVEKTLHRTTARVTDDLERMAFNTAIAAMIELVNAATGRGGLTRDQLERFVRLLAPFVPHLGEELWAKLGLAPSVGKAPWPTFDPAMLVDDEVEIPVQILGKVRARITVAADASQETLEKAALGHERIQELLAGKQVRKVIVVPGKLVNIVAN